MSASPPRTHRFGEGSRGSARHGHTHTHTQMKGVERYVNKQFLHGLMGGGSVPTLLPHGLIDFT